ncbi:hypothetical protein [Allokutzneria sp. NRRL B-24872]|uniref:hypothetical protein n=1 Tax=Allokutzneria sp. NRRL B-24872 TaxID=1137961 RepID=UPI000A374409|nr:hypothetical protein [Allokutzneria sp. NRRL B-24872]
MQTAIGFEFPAADWLDPFDVDEPRVQWFFVNDDKLSRAWVAPADGNASGQLAEGYHSGVFTNPRSCLYLLEKAAIVVNGAVVREWTPTGSGTPAVEKTCGQHNGRFYVHARSERYLRVHDGTSYPTHEEALAVPASDHPVMVARVLDGMSMW